MKIVLPLKLFVLVIVAAAATWKTMPAQTAFSPAEAAALQSFWSKPGRYQTAEAFGPSTNGPWQARLTPEGSTWLWAYGRAARGTTAKLPTGAVPPTANPRMKDWDAWIEARYATDEFRANVVAATKNGLNVLTAPPPEPGPVPDDLLDLAGEPPVFVAAVKPMVHSIDFGDVRLSFKDNTAVRRKYAYYRFAEGVMDGGSPMKGKTVEELKPLFRKAGVTDSELRVMSAVSLLEGGFDSLNTYDTGYVSVGFIQFASLAKGSGSLGQVLLAHKQADTRSFQADFRRFGIDVEPDGTLVALDIETGNTLSGPAANSQIIKDKRLAAVFARAGKLSEPFKIAQIRVAKDRYYPADDEVTFNMAGAPCKVKVKDVFKTEAGLATLMDRKVNTGEFGDLGNVLTGFSEAYGLTKPEELALLEYQIVRAMRFRKDYMEAADLTKPRDLGIALSRGGQGRSGTTGGTTGG